LYQVSDPKIPEVEHVLILYRN